jgi:hypothetical protein
MSLRTMTGCLLVVVLISAVGCSNRPPRLKPPAINASAAGSKAMEMYDADKDGKISGEELDKCPALKAAIAQIDETGGDVVTAARITARIKKWQDSQLGRMSLSCTILRNGVPMADAEVKFVPEAFLGNEMKTASGKTDKNGVAMISVPLAERVEGTLPDPPGVAPGLYRVEVTKGSEIPAKYNTETTLGQEVALDAKGIQEGIKFDLKY